MTFYKLVAGSHRVAAWRLEYLGPTDLPKPAIRVDITDPDFKALREYHFSQIRPEELLLWLLVRGVVKHREALLAAGNGAHHQENIASIIVADVVQALDGGLNNDQHLRWYWGYGRDHVQPFFREIFDTPARARETLEQFADLTRRIDSSVATIPLEDVAPLLKGLHGCNGHRTANRQVQDDCAGR